MAEEEKQEPESQEPDAEQAEAAPEGEQAPAEEPAAEERPAEEPAAEEPPAEEPAAEEAPAQEPVAEEAPEDPHPKTARKRARSRASEPPKPPRSPSERASEREQLRRARAAARRRHRAATRSKRGEPREGTPRAERRPGARKVRQGTVISSKPDKTITVQIEIARRHPSYEKVVRRSATVHAHDERNDANEGDIVRVVEARPLSRTKRWRLVEVLERAR